MSKYKNDIDRLIGESLEKPGKDDGPVVFDYLFKRKSGHRCSVCDTFYFDSENMIDEFGVCKDCWKDLKELEREEKKYKAIP